MAWFPGDGSAADRSFNPYASGRVGQAFDLVGRNKFVSLPDAFVLRPTSLTLEGWVNFNSVPPDIHAIAAKTVGTGNANSYALHYWNGRLIGLVGTRSGDGGSVISVIGCSAIGSPA